jgi:hypothetical protein
LIYFCHEAESFFEGDDDFLVVGDVVIGDGAAFAVYKPLFADLIAANVEIPVSTSD